MKDRTERSERWDNEGRSYHEGTSAAANGEHWFAWLLVVAALALGTIGLLSGFDVIDLGDVAKSAGASSSPEVAGTDSYFKAGLLWILPAISIAMLSYALHRNEHHMHRSEMSGGTKLFNTEHAIAYLLALGTIAAATIGLLVGYDAFDRGNVVEDGFLWEAAAIGLGVLAGTMHSVRHHQMEDEEYIVGVMERRSRTTERPERMRERDLERESLEPRG